MPLTLPTRFLTAPGKTATGPRELFPVIQLATRPNDPEAVLPTGAGVNAAVIKQNMH